MQFLTPIWLFAFAALSIPLVIHLWNIRPGKTLKVGSIALISEASKSNRRSFKILDVLLLLLRCLMLILLAVFLAMPFWNHVRPAEKVKGWVLLPKQNLKESYQKFKPSIDSFTRAGYEFHYFQTGFAKADLNKTLTDTAKLTDSLPVRPVNYWGLTKELNSRVSSALPVYLFTNNSAIHFTGSKPAVSLNLHWQTYTAADSVSRWIAAASFTNTSAVKVTTGNSGPAGTYFTDHFLQNDDNRNTDINITVQNGKATISLNGSAQPALAIDTTTVKIAIYTDKYATDAGYLNAALSAIAKFKGNKTIIKRYNNPAQISGNPTWLFWLSDGPVSSRLMQSANIFKYEAGKIQTVSSWISAEPQALAEQDKNIPLFKMISSNNDNDPVWQDGFGNALLNRQGNVYHFYSRFNPLWNDLVWNDAFPAMMLKLLNGATPPVPPQYDKRVLPNRQLQPDVVKTEKMIAVNKTMVQTDLSKYFWLMLIVIFVAERLLAHKNKQVVNG